MVDTFMYMYTFLVKCSRPTIHGMCHDTSNLQCKHKFIEMCRKLKEIHTRTCTCTQQYFSCCVGLDNFYTVQGVSAQYDLKGIRKKLQRKTINLYRLCQVMYMYERYNAQSLHVHCTVHVGPTLFTFNFYLNHHVETASKYQFHMIFIFSFSL